MMEDQSKQHNGSDEKLLVAFIVTVVVIYALIYIITIFAVILTICLTAGGAYLGVKLALDSNLWQSRRIARDNQLEAARQQELAHFQAQDNEWMRAVLNNYYDDKKRDLYRDRNRLEDVARDVRRVKDMLK